MLELQQHDEIDPLCPFCDTPLSQLWFSELRGMMGKRYVYFCPHCAKVIGISHRKGFWMG